MLNDFLDSIYRDLFLSDKINPNAKILIVTMNENDNFNYLENNKDVLYAKNLKFCSNLEYVDHRFPKDAFDYVIINHLFSIKSELEVELLFIQLKKTIKEDGVLFFINELIIYQNQLDYHPLTLCRNLLSFLPYISCYGVISMDKCYDLLRNNSFQVIDCDRKKTIDLIPTYPIDIYVIACISK